MEGRRGCVGSVGSLFRLIASLDIRMLEKTVHNMPPLLGTAAKPSCFVELSRCISKFTTEHYCMSHIAMKARLAMLAKVEPIA